MLHGALKRLDSCFLPSKADQYFLEATATAQEGLLTLFAELEEVVPGGGVPHALAVREGQREEA